MYEIADSRLRMYQEKTASAMEISLELKVICKSEVITDNDSQR